MNGFSWLKKNWHKLGLVFILAVFLIIQIPKIGLRPSRENVFERQAQTVGVARLYCLDSSRHPLASPQLPFGKGAFNMELTVFEWAEGLISRTVDGGSCESVEMVSQLFAIVSALLSIFLAYFIGLEFFGQMAAFLCAFALAFDSYWLKFSTYMLLDIRAVAFAFLGGLFCYRKKWAWASFAWFISGTHRPQAFMAMAPFFIILLLVQEWIEKSKINRKSIQKIIPIFIGGFFALIYHAYSAIFNRNHDLPWFTWSGPRIFKTYFGDWSDRFEIAYWKSLVLEWFHKPALNLVFFALILMAISLYFFEAKNKKQNSKNFKFLKKLLINVLILSLSFLVARFLYTFLFLKVVKWHDYYAIPLNGLGALLKGCILGYILKEFISYSSRKEVVIACFSLILNPLLFWAILNVRADYHLTAERKNPESSLYYHDWGLKIFPNDHELVVVVHLEAARDMGYLFISKHPGFTWCNRSPETAPRLFWKNEGVKYVAWPKEIDPQSHQRRWLVRSIDEELAYARNRGWSSDINDYWAGHTMAEWSQYASRNTIDPCQGTLDERNPQMWKYSEAH